MLALAPDAQISTSTKSSWKHLDENTVMIRLLLLIDHPTLISQGALGLCGEAAFYHHILQRLSNTGTFFRMAQALLRDGICRFGDLKIHPRPRLLQGDYQGHTIKYANMPPQADWMLLTALRDSENRWSHHYDGSPEAGRAEGSTLHQQFSWYRRCGLYRKNEIGFLAPTLGDPIPQGDIFLKVRKTDTNHIVLSIKMAMIQPGTEGGHAISLASKLTFKDALGQVVPTDNDDLRPSNFDNWSVSFNYWSWGDDSHPNVAMTFDDFYAHFMGAIIAPYDL